MSQPACTRSPTSTSPSSRKAKVLCRAYQQHVNPHDTVALRNLDTKQHALEAQAKAVRERLAAEEAEVEGLQHTLGALREQEASLPQRVEQLSRVLETKEATIAARERELAQDAAGSSKKLQALQQAVDLFQQRLGLVFHQPEGGWRVLVAAHALRMTDGSGELQLVFSHLSEQQPEATCMVAVRVADDETYTGVLG